MLLESFHLSTLRSGEVSPDDEFGFLWLEIPLHIYKIWMDEVCWNMMSSNWVLMLPLNMLSQGNSLLCFYDITMWISNSASNLILWHVLLQIEVGDVSELMMGCILSCFVWFYPTTAVLCSSRWNILYHITEDYGFIKHIAYPLYEKLGGRPYQVQVQFADDT